MLYESPGRATASQLANHLPAGINNLSHNSDIKVPLTATPNTAAHTCQIVSRLKAAIKVSPGVCGAVHFPQ